MKILNFLFLILAVTSLTGCEEVIDLDLNSSDPKFVIEADLNDLSNEQIIRVSQTVNVDEPYSSKAVNDAIVHVTDVQGKQHNFTSIGDGIYRSTNFRPAANGKYSLRVNIGDEEFLSTTTRVPYVNVDSLGIMEEEIFNEYYFVLTFKFFDPKNVDNYYKYSYSVNGGPFKFGNVFSDKFNNGLYVTHEITDRDEDTKFVVGDSIIVRRECIAKDVYDFWSELKSINPGTAAPANPKSNISNGSLGYFSVSSAKLYAVKIEQIRKD